MKLHLFLLHSVFCVLTFCLSYATTSYAGQGVNNSNNRQQGYKNFSPASPSISSVAVTSHNDQFDKLEMLAPRIEPGKVICVVRESSSQLNPKGLAECYTLSNSLFSTSKPDMSGPMTPVNSSTNQPRVVPVVEVVSINQPGGSITPQILTDPKGDDDEDSP